MSKKTITRLLLVEDNPGDVRLLREMLERQRSHNIELAHLKSMSEAERHLAERGVDTVLLDLGLPDAQGLEAGTASPRSRAPRSAGADEQSGERSVAGPDPHGEIARGRCGDSRAEVS